MADADQPGPAPAGGRYPGPVLRTAAAYGWRLLVVGLVVYVLLLGAGRLLTVIIPFTLALLVTALLRPVMTTLVRWGLPRAAATAVTFVGAVLVVAGILALVVTRAIAQAPQLGTEINRVIPQVEHWLTHGPLHLDQKTIANFSSTLSKQVGKNSSAIASTAVSTGRTVLDILTGIVLAVFSTIFLLYDGPRIWRFLLGAVPIAGRSRADRAGQAAWATLVHYARGTVVVAVFHGVVVAVVLTILGVPLVAPLALFVAVGSFVPLVGTIVTGAVAVGVAGLAGGVTAAVVMLVVLIVENQVDAHLLQPFVVGRYVRIHPLAVILSLAAGAILAGIYGALIAVPVVACLNSAVHALRQPDEVMPGGRSPMPPP